MTLPSLLLASLSSGFVCVCVFRATGAASGSSQARGQIGATAVGLHHSHSNARSEPCLQPMPQLMAVLDTKISKLGQRLNPHPHGD